MYNVFNDCKVTVLTAQVLDNAICTFRGVDMAADGGYEGVAFAFGVVEGAEYTDYVAKVQTDAVSNFATPSDVTGSAITFDSITGVVTAEIDIKKPAERYVRPILTAPNVSATCVVCCTAIQYNGRSKPATQDATTTGSWTGEYHSEPAAGTA